MGGIICIVGSRHAFTEWVRQLRATFPNIGLVLLPGEVRMSGTKVRYRHTCNRNQIRGLNIVGQIYLDDAHTLDDIDGIREELAARKLVNDAFTKTS